MSYARKQDLVDRFTNDELVKLTDDARPQVTIDDTKVARALTDTDSLINSYIGSRYTVPIVPVPSALNEKACAIARYKLWRDKASARVEQDYKDALAWLTQLANGTAVLADATALPTEQKPGGSAKISAPDRVFTRDSMRSL